MKEKRPKHMGQSLEKDTVIATAATISTTVNAMMLGVEAITVISRRATTITRKPVSAIPPVAYIFFHGIGHLQRIRK
jgi:hypothetical protein